MRDPTLEAVAAELKKCHAARHADALELADLIAMLLTLAPVRAGIREAAGEADLSEIEEASAEYRLAVLAHEDASRELLRIASQEGRAS